MAWSKYEKAKLFLREEGRSSCSSPAALLLGWALVCSPLAAWGEEIQILSISRSNAFTFTERCGEKLIDTQRRR